MFSRNPLSSLKPAGQSIIRFFSSSSINNAREYKSVVNRQLKKQVPLSEGDLKPRELYIPKEIPKYPAYPYGESRIFKRSNRGLFGGQVISFGNQVSEMRNKARRTWLPNIITKSLWSESLNRSVRMKMTARVLRTITKEGGLDNYLTKDKQARIKELGPFGWKLRYDVLISRSKKDMKPHFSIAKDTKGERIKVYYTGNYNGEKLKLKIGKRRLLTLLFPVVKNDTIGELKFSTFNVARAKLTIGEIIRECEKYKIDLKQFSL